MFQQMIEYKRKHGHLKFGRQPEPNDRRIGEWIRAQRRLRFKIKGNRLRKLNSVGFEWNRVSDSIWDRNLAMYIEFVKKNGMYCVPQKRSILSSWIKRQRDLNLMGILPDERKEKLEETGFFWKPIKVSERVTPTCVFTFARNKVQKPVETKSIMLDEIWNSKYEALIEFKNRFGHCDVSKGFNPRLKQWADFQRLRWRKGILSVSRENRLDAIRFVWYPRITRRASVEEWQRMFRQLKVFKDKFGHCNVPTSDRDNQRELREWVEAHRQDARTLASDRRAQLDELGFCWISPGEDKKSPEVLQGATRKAHDVNNAHDNETTELEEGRVPSMRSESTSSRKRQIAVAARRTPRRHCVRTRPSPLRRHVQMSDRSLAQSSIEKPVLKIGCDDRKEPSVGIKSNSVEGQSVRIRNKVATEQDEGLETPLITECIKANPEQVGSSIEIYGGKKMFKSMGRKKQESGRQHRRQDILFCQMKFAEFATDSVGHKVMARLLARTRMGDFKI